MNNNDEILDANLGEASHKTEIELVDFGKFIILFVVTLGLYGIWWMYKTWRFFKEKDDLDIMPAARAIFSIFFTYSLFDDIKNYAKTVGYTGDYSSGLLFVGYLILSLLGNLPAPFFVVSVFSFIFFMKPVNALNFAIDHSPGYSAKRGAFNTRQIILIIVGGLFWLLMLIGIFA
jgi:hypothetical protein